MIGPGNDALPPPGRQSGWVNHAITAARKHIAAEIAAIAAIA
jgi:hypothetical protein